MKMLEIVPVEGRSLPREDVPQRRITGPCSVPDRAYYRRAIRRGDIKLAEASKAKKKEG